MTKVYSLPPIPYNVQKFDVKTQSWIWIAVKYIFNTLHFGITKDITQGKLLGLAHLPSQRIITYGKLRRLKSVADEVDLLPLVAFNLDKLPTNQGKMILEYIQKKVKE